MVVAITRSDLSADALRLVARWSKDICQARRLLALAQVLDGHPRGEAARAGGMSRRLLKFVGQALLVKQATQPWRSVQGQG